MFQWHDVNYDVQIKGNTRRLLNNVSGFVAPGKSMLTLSILNSQDADRMLLKQ